MEMESLSAISGMRTWAPVFDPMRQLRNASGLSTLCHSTFNCERPLRAYSLKTLLTLPISG